jgi:hypothetical protein
LRFSKFSLVAAFGAAGVALACFSLAAAPRSYWRASSSFPDTQPQTPGSGAPSPADATKQAKAASDAAAKVFPEVALGSSLTADADKDRKQVTDITGATTKRSQSPLEDIQTIQSVALAIQHADLINALTKAKNALDPNSSGSLEAARKMECDKLTQYASLNQQDVTDAQSKCADAEKQAADGVTSLTTSLAQLQSALSGVYSYTDTQVSALNTQLKPLATLLTGTLAPDASQLVKSLPSGLIALKQLDDVQDAYKGVWLSAKSVLQALAIAAPAAIGTPPAPDVDTRFKELQDSINTILPKLDSAFVTLATSLIGAAKGLDGMLADVASDPANNVAKANGAIADQSDSIAAADSIVGTWPLLLRYLTDQQPSGFDLKGTKKHFDDLQTAVTTLRASISRMHDAVGGDMSKFENDQVSLYYFTDVARLMRALNENSRLVGGLADAQANAATQRTALAQAEFDLSDAQGTVNRYTKQVADLQEQQRQASAKLKNLNAQLSKFADRLKGAQDNKDQAANAYNSAQQAQSANPNDPTLAAAAQKDSANQTVATTKLSQAQSDYDSAKTDRDQQQSRLDDSQNQSDSLPSKLAAAQQSLSDAQTAVAGQRRKMLLAAQAESDAFALARDNAPDWFAPADASSSDPLKRVILWAYNDNKTIHMRGLRNDINRVKRMIAEYDRPAPQALLTLWTLELSADSGQKTNSKTAEALNSAMQIVDEELGNSRARVNATLSLFQGLINEEVRAFETANRNASGQIPAGTNNVTDADQGKWRRAHFYDPAVLRELGINLTGSMDWRKFRDVVPDPSGTSTLGEALLVLALARPDTAACIRDLFEARLNNRLKALQPILTDEARKHPDSAQQHFDSEVAGIRHPLVGTWLALGIAPPVQNAAAACTATTSTYPATPSYDIASGNMTPQQKEITAALNSSYDSAFLRDAADQFKAWYEESAFIESRLTTLDKNTDALLDLAVQRMSDADKQSLSALQVSVAQQSNEYRRLTALSNSRTLVDADQTTLTRLQGDRDKLDARIRTMLGSSPVSLDSYRQISNEQAQLQTRLTNIRIDSAPVVQVLIAKFGLAPSYRSTSLAEKGSIGFQVDFLRSMPLDFASPLEAKADHLLQSMIDAVSDDLDALYMISMSERIRMRLTTQSNVRVGVFQRESILATNRGVARIDPSASAQLAVGDEEDILSGIQQLAQLYATVQSGGALAAIGALQAQPREPAPEIYALTTGNQFKVTPIFDPTGQALRFKFDFLSTSKLQEPNGTVNPQLSRIERHTVNTEVQLNNLQSREISRFESNARLGLPTTYSGGVPVLKDIPYVRPWVPLIGWFVRKAGSNASAQQSVIFARTTMYPTIANMLDLVTSKSPVTGSN